MYILNNQIDENKDAFYFKIKDMRTEYQVTTGRKQKLNRYRINRNH